MLTAIIVLIENIRKAKAISSSTIQVITIHIKAVGRYESIPDKMLITSLK